jgi:hypothetical protein
MVFATASLGASEPARAQGLSSDPLLASFQTIVDDFNDNNLDTFVSAVDQQALLGSIFSERLIDARVKDGLKDTFATDLKRLYVDAFKGVDGEILGKIVGFRSDGSSATAVVRFDLPRYKFIYHEFDLRAGTRNRVRIMDWVDFNKGERFSDAFGEMLVTVIADDDATRSILRPLVLTDPEAFQTSELLKAARDGKQQRYFDILSGLDERIREHQQVALLSLQMARQSKDRKTYQEALTVLVENYATEPLYSMTLLDYYLPRGNHQAALEALLRLGDRLGVEDPALKSQIATLSLIVGNVDDASTYAEAAVAEEPELELAWWAALRSRTAKERYDEAVEALGVLEDRFGHKLRTTALEKDKLLARLMETEQFKAWSEAE